MRYRMQRTTDQYHMLKCCHFHLQTVRTGRDARQARLRFQHHIVLDQASKVTVRVSKESAACNTTEQVVNMRQSRIRVVAQ